MRRTKGTMRRWGLTAGLVAWGAGSAWAADAPGISAGDTAWVLISAALVLLMAVPALGLFYGGLVRRKNILSVLMQCFMIVSIVSVQWVLFGYSLSFGPDIKSMIGSLGWMGLRGVGFEANPDYAATIPHQAFMVFQMMFAAITPALIIGAFAERMKFLPCCMFMLVWTTVVYDPVCHWVWGTGGFLRQLGALDFAGGTVVHINAGMAALAAALVLGKRQGHPHDISPPQNMPFAVLGAGLLWFGWFGFNGGSALAANGLAVNAFVVTHITAASAGIAWACMDMLFSRKPTMLGIISGVVAGLVSITPAAGFVNAIGALGVGVGAGVICYVSVAFVKVRFGYDDALDAFGVHGIGGIWGAIATGLFATTSVNPAGANGFFLGNPKLVLIQTTAVAVTVVYSFGVSFVLLKVVDALSVLRATEQDERIGLDLTEHRESAYTVID